jgi:uncharacterized RmlC-like cupin family protein
VRCREVRHHSRHVFGTDPQQPAASSAVFDMLLKKFFPSGRGKAVDEVYAHDRRPLSVSIERAILAVAPGTLLDPRESEGCLAKFRVIRIPRRIAVSSTNVEKWRTKWHLSHASSAAALNMSGKCHCVERPGNLGGSEHEGYSDVSDRRVVATSPDPSAKRYLRFVCRVRMGRLIEDKRRSLRCLTSVPVPVLRVENEVGRTRNILAAAGFAAERPVSDRPRWGILRHAMHFAPGAVVPMHSHPDRETFYVISAHPDAFRSDHWKTLGPGDVIDSQTGIKHAWRNSSETAASMLCATTMRMARMLRDVAVDGGSEFRRRLANPF